MANEALERVWMRVRDELRRQRGMSRFRGTEVHLLPKRQIRIPVENRRSELRSSELIIHLTEVESDLWAILEPEGERFTMQQSEYRLDHFIQQLLTVARGDAYLHTNSKTATYRKVDEKEGNNDAQ